MKEKVIKYLKSQYSEDRITEMIDEEIVSGNWLDDDWDQEYEDEYEWYQDHGNNEAEDAVRDQIEEEILKHFNLTREQYVELTDEQLYETIQSIYSKLEN